MSSMSSPLEQKISSNSKIVIKPLVKGFNENTPICAINWFDLRIGWLYKLYTLIAAKLVAGVSGKLYFKGKLHCKLEGPEIEQRHNLMIVCYTNPKQFLKVVKIKLFQLISILRIASVKQFCFGFTENLVDKSDLNNHFKKDQLYLVHHFQGSNGWLRENLRAIINTTYQSKTEMFFCGMTSAHLVKEKSGQQQAADFFMDGMIIFSADSEENFEELVRNDIYRIFKRQNKVNGLYLFTRTH